MSDLISRLDRLNARRSRLNDYIARVKMAFWMPKLQKRMLFRLHKKLRQVAAERSRVLDNINANPALRQQLRTHERQQTQSSKASPPTNQLSTPHTAPQSNANLTDQAAALHQLKAAERLAKTAYQQAVWYYKSGEWKTHNISAEQVGQLLDTLKADYRQSANTRVAEQQSFEDAVRALNPSDPRHILDREKLLAAASKQHPADDPLNAFENWAKTNTPQHDRQPSEGPYKRRGRGR